MAQRFSQNGWPAYATTSHFTRFTAAGQKWWAANADVAVVFKEFIERFDREVEEITQPTLDDWSYANRLVRGSSSVVSNHGSATAIDINALKHPRGVHNTFSAAKQATMHRLRNAITDNSGRPVLRLGMDYTTTVDDMHVEIDANAARVKQAANKIRARQQQEEDMAAPTTAEIVAALKPVIAAEVAKVEARIAAKVREQLIDVLKKEPLALNKPSTAELEAAAAAGRPAPTGSLASAAFFLGNIEGDQDNDRDIDREARARIEGKLDQLLALLGAPGAGA